MNGLNFSLSETHRMMLEVVRGVLRKLEPRRDDYLKQIYEQQRFPDAIWDAMAEAGIIGALVSENYGGSGVGLLGMTLALEEFASVGLINAFCILNSMANTALLHGGSTAQKAHWLPKVADGSVKFAFAITEPDAGTNSFQLRSLARRDGEVYRLNHCFQRGAALRPIFDAFDDSHGRLVRRRVFDCPEAATREALSDWPGLHTVLAIESIRSGNGGGKVEAEIRYFLSSFTGDPQVLAQAIRHH